MTVHLGAIGLGAVGNAALGLYDEMDDVTIVAGADVAENAVRRFEEQFHAPGYEDYQTLLDGHADELDAVSIITPHTLHYEQAKAALLRDLAVYVEKPLTTGVSEAVDLVETAAERDCILAVGYQRHFHPAYRELRQIVEEGTLGDLHAVNCYLGQNWFANVGETWRTDPALSGGGQLYDSGSHLFDAILWTTASTPLRVVALIDERGRGVDINSALAAQLDKDGTTITASVGLTAEGTNDESPEEGLTLWGTKGHASYETDTGQVRVHQHGRPGYIADIQEAADFLTLTEAKLRDFVTSVQQDRQPAVPGDVGLSVTAFTEAAYASAERGDPVAVQDLIEKAYHERRQN